jgi:hypothetical protein
MTSEDHNDTDGLLQDVGEVPPDRKLNESIEPSEADAFGGWFFHNDTQTLEFHLRNVAISGKRYPNDQPGGGRSLATIYTLLTLLLR